MTNDRIELWCNACQATSAVIEVRRVANVGGGPGPLIALLECGHGRCWKEGVET